MPIDLSYVPAARQAADFRTPLLLWILLFVLVVGGGVLLVLGNWPAGVPVHTPWFWFCVVFLPLACWLLLVCLVKLAQNSAQASVDDHNAARAAWLEQAEVQAQVGISVLAVAHRYDSDDALNDASLLAANRLTLSTPGRQRYFILPDQPFYPGNLRDDMDRQRAVLAWLLHDLLQQCMPVLDSLPMSQPLTFRVFIAGELESFELEDICHTAWQALLPSRPVSIDIVPESPSLLAIDQCLDGNSDTLSTDRLTLLCVCRLLPVLSAELPEQQTEAACMLLLAPPSIAGLPGIATLHRPVNHADPKLAIDQALRWGKAAAAAVQDLWQGELDSALATALLLHGSAIGLGVISTEQLCGQHLVPSQIGQANAASHWLTLALAIRHCMVQRQPQLVAVQENSNLQAGVIQPAER